MADQRDDEFEQQLQIDLPRGMGYEVVGIGVNRTLLARWLTPDEMIGNTWEATNGGLLLGRRQGREIGWNDNRHALSVAGSRAGKGVSLIIPNLLMYKGSVVVIDPKGENAARTARRRGTGVRDGAGLNQDVYILDPFGESGLPTNAFNPLHGLNPESPEVIEEVGLFADALIIHNEKDRHWTESAQALLRALILVVIMDQRFKDRCNLVTVRKLLMLSDPAIEKAMVVPGGQLSAEQALIRILKSQEQQRFGHICLGVGEQLEAMADKERGSVLSSARTQTQWLDSPLIEPVVSGNDFDLADLKRSKKGMSVYLCLPAMRMGTHAGWLRLIVLLAIGSMEKIKCKPQTGRPVLFVLDEFPVLGYMRAIETAAGFMAGFGVKLWPIVQNVGQLKQHYSRTWETFFANAGVVTAFGVSDWESLQVLSRWIGRTSIAMKSDQAVSRAQSMQGGSKDRSNQQFVPLLAEDELRMIFGRKMDRMLVFNVEEHPAIVRRFKYYDVKDPLFAGLYDPDPHYADA